MHEDLSRCRDGEKARRRRSREAGRPPRGAVRSNLIYSLFIRIYRLLTCHSRRGHQLAIGRRSCSGALRARGVRVAENIEPRATTSSPGMSETKKLLTRAVKADAAIARAAGGPSAARTPSGRTEIAMAGSPITAPAAVDAAVKYPVNSSGITNRLSPVTAITLATL